MLSCPKQAGLKASVTANPPASPCAYVHVYATELLFWCTSRADKGATYRDAGRFRLDQPTLDLLEWLLSPQQTTASLMLHM